MLVDVMLKEIVEQNEIITKANGKINELTQKIKEAPAEDYDWMTVVSAAALLEKSVAFIYRKINDGTLSCKLVGSRRYVKTSEIKTIGEGK